MLGANPAQKQVAIGDRQRPATPIAGGSRSRSGRFRADPETHPVEPANRATACRNGMDLHHWRANADSSDVILVAELETARIVRDVGRSPAHVEADQAIRAVWRASRNHSDHPSRRTGQDRVLAPE